MTNSAEPDQLASPPPTPTLPPPPPPHQKKKKTDLDPRCLRSQLIIIYQGSAGPGLN